MSKKHGNSRIRQKNFFAILDSGINKPCPTEGQRTQDRVFFLFSPPFKRGEICGNYFVEITYSVSYCAAPCSSRNYSSCSAGVMAQQGYNCAHCWDQPCSEGAKVVLMTNSLPASGSCKEKHKRSFKHFLSFKETRAEQWPPQEKQTVVRVPWTFKTAQFRGQECCFSPWVTRLGMKLWYCCISHMSRFITSLTQPWKHVGWENTVGTLVAHL